MKTITQFFITVLTLFFIGCGEQPKSKETSSEIKNDPIENNAMIPTSWVSKRVEKAKNRLEQTEAGKVVWNAMEAHGGLARYYGNGALAFRFNYQPLDDKPQRDSYQTIDTWSNRALHTSATDSTASFGWTGEKAWVNAKDSTAFAYDTKFWALTPLYFFGQPFVLDGQGVNLELLRQETYKDKLNDVVKITFDVGTGDAPDDYYILYFDTETHLLKVIRYIVSYPSYFKGGGHAPEKFMEVLGSQPVDGITFPTEYKTYWLKENQQPGEYITKIEVSNVSFVNNLEEDFFDAPEGAKVIEGL